jgi:hypothetical protein
MGNEENRWQAVDDALQELEKDMRDILGDEGAEFSKRLAMQRASFKTDLSKIESGKSGPAMAEFLNGHAWLWKHVREDVERDPQYKAMVERALILCVPFDVPEEWQRAVKMAEESYARVVELRR